MKIGVIVLLSMLVGTVVAEVSVQPEDLHYTAESQMFIVNDELDQQVMLSEGESVTVPYNQVFVVTSSTKKEVFRPAAEAPNLGAVVGFNIPRDIRSASLLHLVLGEDSKCELMLLDEELSLIASNKLSRFLAGLAERRVLTIQKEGYLSLTCIK